MDEEKKPRFHPPYVNKVAKRYSLHYGTAVVLFNTLLRLGDCKSRREIERVQSFCFYADEDNGALQALYKIIANTIGAYRPEGRKPIYKLRPYKKRDAPEEEAARQAMDLVREALRYFDLPTDALVLRAPIPPSLRHTAFNMAVSGWDEVPLAHTKTWQQAERLSRFMRESGKEGEREESCITQNGYASSLLKGFKGKKTLMYSLGVHLHILARLAMSDSMSQAAAVVGYLRSCYPALADVLIKVLTETVEGEYDKPRSRLPPSLRPFGEPLHMRGVAAVLKAIEALARDESTLEVFGGTPEQARLRLIDMLKGLLPRVRYTGRLAARDRTATFYNHGHKAEHFEIDDLDETIAIAVSRKAAMRIVKAEEAIGRRKALERAQKAIAAYLSADDLI